MKKLFFGALVACAAATFVGCGNSTPKADLKTDVDTMSYAMGMSQTQGLKEFMVERMGVDTAGAGVTVVMNPFNLSNT